MRLGKHFLRFLLLALGLALGIPPLQAASVPELTARVNDYAAMLSPATRQQLEDLLAQLEREESTQIAVLTITSLQGADLDDYSLKVAETWGLGQKGRDNGALLLIAKNDRKLRIEVGYGLEGSLTDLTAGRIIRDIITPRFRDGNFDLGVLDGVAAMIGAVRGEFQAPQQAAVSGSTGDDTGGPLVFLGFAFYMLARVVGRNRLAGGTVGAILAPLLGLLILELRWLTALLLAPVGFAAGYLASLVFGGMRFSSGRGSSSAGGFSSGGFSSGFGGGGGGGFGGGGASGGW